MNKECFFCQKTFEANRSDAKYCSGSCKQEAYLARKNSNNVSSNNNIAENTPRRNNVRNVNPSITLSRSEFQRILNTNSSKAPLDQLLNEKDFGRQVLSENAELRIELKYLNKDLEAIQKRLETIELENKDLIGKVESQEESSIDKLLNGVLASDSLTPIIGAIVGKAMGSANIGSPPVTSTEPLEQTESKQDHQFSEEAKLEDEYLTKLEEVYPNIPPHVILGKLVELIESNKVLADSILKEADKS